MLPMNRLDDQRIAVGLSLFHRLDIVVYQKYTGETRYRNPMSDLPVHSKVFTKRPKDNRLKKASWHLGDDKRVGGLNGRR